MGAVGFRGSWSDVFPDNFSLLFNMMDLELSGDEKRIKLHKGTI